MAVKENDWFAINLLNKDVDALDLVANDINAENTTMFTSEHYKDLPAVREAFKDSQTGKFDETAFNNAYNSALYTYNQMANTDYEDALIKTIEKDPDDWFDTSAKIRDVSATVTLSDDPYHRGAGLSGLQSISDPNWSTREIAQAQEATDENGVGLGWSPNDHALLSGSLKSLWQPTLALAAWDEDGVHLDADGNEITHKKGEYKLNKDGEFYYEKLGGRSAVGKELLRVSDTITIDGTQINKFDVFDADSINKSAGGTIVRTALELAPLLIPGVNQIWGIIGAVYHTAEVMPTLAKALNNILGNGEESDFGKTLNRASNFFKRFDSTQSDSGREKFMSFEQVCTQIGDIANQLYQQKFVGKLGQMISQKQGAKAFENTSKLGQRLSTTYMAATSGMDSYEMFKEAGLNDTWAGLGTLAVIAGFYAFMSQDYYKDVLFGENSILNEEFVVRNTVKAVGEELNAAIRGIPTTATGVEAKGIFQRIFNSTKRNASSAVKKIKSGLSKEGVGNALATAETKAAETTAATAAEKLSMAKVQGMAEDAVKHGVLGKSDSGSSWFNIMLNRASNEAVEEMMEEAMQDTAKGITLAVNALGFDVKDEKADDIDYNFSFEDFFTRYLTAGIGGFVGGSLFAGLDKWEKIWSPNMREITSKGLSNGERIAYIIKEGGKENLLNHISKLEKKGVFGSTNLSYKGTPYIDMDGNATWNFQATENPDESQNAMVANGLRAYVNYIEQTMAAYDNIMLMDKDLSKILRNTDAENKEAVEVLKRDHPFTYKQLEKEAAKRNKNRDPRSREWTVQDMYETYNYADGVVRALDKCGYFQDFYHDYLMLGTKLIGLKYNLDKQEQDYKLAHPNDKTGWNNNPIKKRIEEKIKDVEKQRDSILNGEKNADYIQRAIYMAWDPINRAFTELEDNDSQTLAETSLYNYAMSRYNLDLHDPDMTADEKEQLEKEFEDYKKLKDLDKIRSSYDIFINLANLFNPSIKSYIEEDVNKPLNPLFSSAVNAPNAQAKIAQLRNRLKQLQDQLSSLNLDATNDTWDNSLKNRYASIFQNLGIKLSDVNWVDDLEGGAIGAYDATNEKFLLKKGVDPEETIKTIIHEVVGHYGLRQLINGPMKLTFQSQLGNWLSDHPKEADAIVAEFGKYNRSSANQNDNFDLVMHILYTFADSDIKSKIDGYSTSYKIKDEDLESAIVNWFDDSIDLQAKTELKGLVDEGYLVIPDEDINNKALSDLTKDSLKSAYAYKNKALLVEEYLAELAAETIKEEDLSKSEKNWLQKIVDFFKCIFGLDGTKVFDKKFFETLITLSKDNLKNTSKSKTFASIYEKALNPTISEEEKEKIINDLYNKFTDIDKNTGIVKIDPNKYIKKLKNGSINFPAVPIPSTKTTDGALYGRSITRCDNFSDLIKYLKFGLDDSNNESKSISGIKVSTPFLVFGDKNIPFRGEKNDIAGIIINTQNLSDEDIAWIESKIENINSDVSIIKFDGTNFIWNGKATPNLEFKDWNTNNAEFNKFLDNYAELKDWYTNDTTYTPLEKKYILKQAKLTNLSYIFDTEGHPMFGEWKNIITTNAEGLTLNKTVFVVKYWARNANFKPKSRTPIVVKSITAIDEDSSGLIFAENTSDGKLYINQEMFDLLQETQNLTYQSLTPDENAAIYEMSNIQWELNILNTLTVQSRQLAVDNGATISNALYSLYEQILNPEEDAKRITKDIIEQLQIYANECTGNNIANPNLAWVYEQINYLKQSLISRLRYEILSKIAIKTNTNFGYWNNWDNKQQTSITSLLSAIINADFKNDLTEREDAINTAIDEMQNILFTVDSEGELIFDIQDLFKSWFNPGNTEFGEALQTMLSTFAEESKALYKFYELLNFDRLGDTIKLSDWINLALKGAGPEEQVDLQDYAMESSDFSELINNINLTQKIVRIMIDAAHCNNQFGFNLFGLFNMYAGSDFYNFIGEGVLDKIDNEFEIFANKMNFLSSISGLQSERQIKVQKEIAKNLNYNLMYRILNIPKIFNVDIPELWEKAGGQDLSTIKATMSDDQFAVFFKAIKKFEQLLYEKVNNESSFTSKTDDEKIKSIFELFNKKGLHPGTINENTKLSDFSMAAYLYSILTVNADDFYSRLINYLTNNSDSPIPFSSQIFAIRLGDAYLRDSKNGLNKLSNYYKDDNDCFLDNLMTIFGSAGTGKTTVIANIIVQMNSDKTIYYSANGESQLKKLEESINGAKPENTFILQQLVDEIAPDWQTNYKIVKDEYAKYTGVIKNSESFDEKLKNNVLIVDECTRLDVRKWQAISQYAKINNVKIIALGDLKQSNETKEIKLPGTKNSIIPLFTDAKTFSTPILTESIRAANQAQRTNMLVFGKQFDTAIDIVSETRNINNAINFLTMNPFVLKYKNITGSVIGANITSSRDELKSKIAEVINNLKDGETIAIVSDSSAYDSLASDGKVEIIKPSDIQGREWTYVFSDFTLNEDQPFLKLQEFYTLISRAKLGSLVLTNSLKDLKITFAEDNEGDKKVAANKNQFNSYGSWMKGLLSNGTAGTTTSSTSTTTMSPSSGTPLDPTASSAMRKRIATRIKSDLHRMNDHFGANPDDYISNLSGELVNEILSNTIDTKTVLYNNKVFIKHGRLKYCSLQFGDAKINFMQTFDPFGEITFVPIKLDDENNIVIDDFLNSSTVIKSIGTLLASRYKSISDDDCKIYSNENDFKNILFDNSVTAENAEAAFSEWLESEADNTLIEAENLLSQGSYDGDAGASKKLTQTKQSLQNARAQQDIIDDNVYVKKLLKNNFGENIPFRKTASLEEKQWAIKVIADLVKLDARRVSTGQTAIYVKDIDDTRYKYIKQVLSKALNWNENSDELNSFLNKILSKQKTFHIKDTNIRGEKEMHLVVDDMDIYIGEIINAKDYDTSGYYEYNGELDSFNMLFRRKAITSAGRKRVNTQDLFKNGMFNVASPAIVVDSNHNRLLTRWESHSEWERVKDFLLWVKRNSGKTMQAYTNVSYLDMTDPTNVYQVHNEQAMDTENNTYSYPYAYNDVYGDLMGIQKVVTLDELYSLSMLAKFAQTGYDYIGEALQETYPNVKTQQDAINELDSILGGNLKTKLKAIPEGALKGTQGTIIKENVRAFREAGVLLNSKNTEKIETLMFLAAMQSEKTGSDLASAVQIYMQKLTHKDQHGIFFFNYYKDSTEYKGTPTKQFKLITDKRKTTSKWTLYEINSEGEDIEVKSWNGNILNYNNLKVVLNQISTTLGLANNTGDPNLIPGFADGHISIQPAVDWHYMDKETKVITTGVTKMPIVEFFSAIISSPNNINISKLFKSCEEIFNKNNNGQRLFRSGIYLETRSSGKSYVPQNGSSDDALWKEDRSSSRIPYSTDIIKIYNPIRSVHLKSLGDKRPISTAPFDPKDLKDIYSRGSDINKEISQIKAKSKEGFLTELNNRLKEKTSNAVYNLQYDENNGYIYVLNKDFINEKLEECTILEDYLDPNGLYCLIENSSGEWLRLNWNGDIIRTFKEDQVKSLKEGLNYKDFKEMFKEFIFGKRIENKDINRDIIPNLKIRIAIQNILNPKTC